MSVVTEPAPKSRKPVPRGIARSGPALLSYGFRPFFMLAGLFAVVAMAGWIGALGLGWEVGGDYGMLNWHAHEMLFGYASAALAGFMLTAIPNWTGRLPVSGPAAARASCCSRSPAASRSPCRAFSASSPRCWSMPPSSPSSPRSPGSRSSAGRNWKNLKILAGLVALSHRQRRLPRLGGRHRRACSRPRAPRSRSTSC